MWCLVLLLILIEFVQFCLLYSSRLPAVEYGQRQTPSSPCRPIPCERIRWTDACPQDRPAFDLLDPQWEGPGRGRCPCPCSPGSPAPLSTPCHLSALAFECSGANRRLEAASWLEVLWQPLLEGRGRVAFGSAMVSLTLNSQGQLS